ncbi:hypothetical protein EVAR_47402_1 [Eumeta japonica]|uniref:Uncharacterized protein n=1 Tax=Eumeta variegata TaxID=151549 RepID=A0A4C1Y3L4_EUMVA|nr:hypothetical protein EVAR_47402_1 [Eumeta japonica]
MMNDQLTPRKITRLLNLAEGILPNYQKNMPVRGLVYQFHENVSKPCETTCVNTASSNENCESSSGILDLECCEGLSSYVDNLSLGKSTFNPGEMTGRSTVAEGSTSKLTAANNVNTLTNDLNANRHSLGATSSIEQLEQRMRQQSADITHLMRHSVCSSQFTQVDLTAEEKLFVAKEGIIPVMPSELNMNLTRNLDVTKLVMWRDDKLTKTDSRKVSCIGVKAYKS